MVVCSCNVLTDAMIKSFLSTSDGCCKARDVYCGLGCSERCGQCARTITAMIDARQADSAGMAPPSGSAQLRQSAVWQMER